MPKEKKRSAKFSQEGIEGLPADKPVTYRVIDGKGNNIYTGSAKKGRVPERLKEHLPGSRDATPGGTRVEIQQWHSIAEAQESEARIIKQAKPKLNKKGK